MLRLPALFLVVLCWVSKAEADEDLPLLEEDIVRRTGIKWTSFLRNHVDGRCFRTCWERWLPEVPADQAMVTNTSQLTSKQLCTALLSARPFQRCYMSHCGGLYARVPSITGLEMEDSLEEQQRQELWALTSDYVERYGAGPYWRLPLDGEGGEPDTTSWIPFPIGLTAACLLSPDQTFTDNLTNHKLIRMKAISSTDGRLKLSQSLRRLIMPVWTSPNLLDYWSYSLRDLGIDQPRSLQDLRRKIIPTYLFALVAYAHLLSISVSSRRYFRHGVQLVAFCLIPLVPAVQLAHNIVDATIMLFTGEPLNTRHTLSGVCGVMINVRGRSNRRRPFQARLADVDISHAQDTSLGPRDGKWWARLSFIFVNLAILIYTTVPYCIRLHQYHWKVSAPTGFDHRNGWISISAIVPILATLMLHVLNREWTLVPFAPQDHILSTCWKTRLAQDMSAATALQELFIMLTRRVTLAQILFDRLLRYRINYVIAVLLVCSSFIISAWKPLSLMYGNPHSRFSKTYPWVLILLSFTYASLVFGLQIFMDMEEYADLTLDFVLPWNWRWQVPDPSWTEWWGL